MIHFKKKAIKEDRVDAVSDLKIEIVKLNKRCSRGKGED